MGNDSPPVKSFPPKTGRTGEPEPENGGTKPYNRVLHLKVVNLPNLTCKYMNAEPGTLEKNHNAPTTPTLAIRQRARQRGPLTGRNAPKTAPKMPHSDDTSGPDGGESPDSVAHYIAAITAELAKMAQRNGLETLSTLLEMAQLEADHIAKHGTSSP
jgi:hypothetical protein